MKYGEGYIDAEGYHKIYDSYNRRMVYAHRVRAQKALGKRLPKGAQVHHFLGYRGPNAQLVICPDQKYHMLLHARESKLMS
jgi:hypothetical protein